MPARALKLPVHPVMNGNFQFVPRYFHCTQSAGSSDIPKSSACIASAPHCPAHQMGHMPHNRGLTGNPGIPPKAFDKQELGSAWLLRYSPRRQSVLAAALEKMPCPYGFHRTAKYHLSFTAYQFKPVFPDSPPAPFSTCAGTPPPTAFWAYSDGDFRSHRRSHDTLALRTTDPSADRRPNQSAAF